MFKVGDRVCITKSCPDWVYWVGPNEDAEDDEGEPLHDDGMDAFVNNGEIYEIVNVARSGNMVDLNATGYSWPQEALSHAKLRS